MFTKFKYTTFTETTNPKGDNSQPDPLNISRRMDNLDPVEVDPGIESAHLTQTPDKIFNRRRYGLKRRYPDLAHLDKIEKGSYPDNIDHLTVGSANSSDSDLSDNVFERAHERHRQDPQSKTANALGTDKKCTTCNMAPETSMETSEAICIIQYNLGFESSDSASTSSPRESLSKESIGDPTTDIKMCHSDPPLTTIDGSSDLSLSSDEKDGNDILICY